MKEAHKVTEDTNTTLVITLILTFAVEFQILSSMGGGFLENIHSFVTLVDFLYSWVCMSCCSNSFEKRDCGTFLPVHECRINSQTIWSWKPKSNRPFLGLMPICPTWPLDLGSEVFTMKEGGCGGVGGGNAFKTKATAAESTWKYCSFKMKQINYVLYRP